MKRAIFFFLILFIAGLGIFLYRSFPVIGREIDSYKGVPVYYNGTLLFESHGQHFSTDGYYYGKKWQCVEFVKRFYCDAKGHKMPDVMGHAKDYFDEEVLQGEINKRRGLVQYRNGGNVRPETDDILVFSDKKYGHVAIITKVTPDYIEVIQQNVLRKTRSRFSLIVENGKYYVGTKRKPAGWLRKKYLGNLIES